MIQRQRFHVEGRVQGVFYRASARAEAQRLGLTGWVRNCDDGAVEGLACGREEAVEAFAAWLWQGPAQAEVARVRLEPSEEIAPPDFRIR